MKLSEAYDKYRTVPLTFACCVGCHGAWIDDMEGVTKLDCPRCDPPVLLLRHAENPKIYGCTIDEKTELDEARERLTKEDPGAQARSLSESKSK